MTNTIAHAAGKDAKTQNYVRLTKLKANSCKDQTVCAVTLEHEYLKSDSYHRLPLSNATINI